MAYTAKIKDAKKGVMPTTGDPYMDIWFDISLDGEIVAERRLPFPMGTPVDAITDEIKKYLQMFENDHALAADAAQRSEAEAVSEEIFSALKDKEI